MLHTTARDARALRRITAWIVASGLALCTATATARPADGPCQAEKQYNVPAKMRDGVTLYADVYRPKGAGSYPVILMRLPYNKDAAQTYVYAPPQFYASHCYIVVIQDVRGQYASEGSFYAFRDEAKDGYDTIEWAAKLPGSNGKVGMYGSSYVGATQWLPATLQPPSLVAIAPAMTSSDYYDGWSYEGGAWSLAFEASWPLVTVAMSGARRLGDQAVLDRMNQAVGELYATYKFLPIKDTLAVARSPGSRAVFLRLDPAQHLGRLLEAVVDPHALRPGPGAGAQFQRLVRRVHEWGNRELRRHARQGRQRGRAHGAEAGGRALDAWALATEGRRVGLRSRR